MTQSDIEMLRYFWENKEDLECYAGYDKIYLDLKRYYPAVIKAWEDYKAIKQTITMLLNNMVEI